MLRERTDTASGPWSRPFCTPRPGNPRFGQSGAGDLKAPAHADGGALIEHREVECFDAVQYLRIQGERGGDARPRPRVQQRNAAARIVVDAPGFGVLLYQRSADPGIGALMGVTPHQHVTIHLMYSELIGGQVNAAALEVFTYVAKKVGELEGFSQC